MVMAVRLSIAPISYSKSFIEPYILNHAPCSSSQSFFLLLTPNSPHTAGFPSISPYSLSRIPCLPNVCTRVTRCIIVPLPTLSPCAFSRPAPPKPIFPILPFLRTTTTQMSPPPTVARTHRSHYLSILSHDRSDKVLPWIRISSSSIKMCRMCANVRVYRVYFVHQCNTRSMTRRMMKHANWREDNVASV